MPCLIALFALLTPRFIIILLALFTEYMSQAYDTVLWPVLGWVFLPYTTLAYAFCWHQNSGEISGIYILVMAIGVILDLGSMGGGASSRRKK